MRLAGSTRIVKAASIRLPYADPPMLPWRG
jgi:hypothetical protein